MKSRKHPQRTKKQNAALHVLFRLLSDELNNHGLDMRTVLKPEIEIQWNEQMVKNYLWRPIMKAQTGKNSTTELNTIEVDKVFDTLNKHIGEKFGLHIPFPSIEDVLLGIINKKE